MDLTTAEKELLRFILWYFIYQSKEVMGEKSCLNKDTYLKDIHKEYGLTEYAKTLFPELG